MTTSLADLLAGVDMEGGENFCDSVYNYLKNKDRNMNLLTNSGFGVWSQSDTNKGLGVIKFDAGGVGEPPVGDIITGAAAGAKAKVIRVFVESGGWAGNNAAGYIILGACGIDTNTTRFHDNETLTYTGGTLDVNYPDTDAHVTISVATITFNDAAPATIVDSGAGFGFANNNVIEVYGSEHNDGAYWVETAAGGTLTLHANESLTQEAEGATVVIVRRGAGDLVRNGDFHVDFDPPRGWTAVTAILTTEAAVGQVGNCMQVASSGAALGKAYQDIITIIGKIYTLALYFKKGSSDTGKFMIGITTDEDSIYDSGDLSDAAWTLKSHTFEATATTTRITMQTTDPTITENSLFDEISLYEITPCCTEADDKAFDGWHKDDTLDIYREHSSEESTTKRGSFYALKCVPSAADDYVIFPLFPEISDEEYWYKQFRGRPVTIGAWVLTNTASHAHAYIGDDVSGAQYSDYHTGGGEWEWLELTFTIDTAATRVLFGFYFAVAGDVDGSTIVYVSQPMLALAPYIGVGNYQPRLQEIIWLEDNIDDNIYSGLFNNGDLGFINLNIEANSDARLPKGCKAVLVRMGINDSGSAGELIACSVQLMGAPAVGSMMYVNVSGLAADAQKYMSEWQACDANGDVSIKIDASGGATLDIQSFRYLGVQVS